MTGVEKRVIARKDWSGSSVQRNSSPEITIPKKKDIRRFHSHIILWNRIEVDNRVKMYAHSKTLSEFETELHRSVT
jgi:hypothetical protein